MLFLNIFIILKNENRIIQVCHMPGFLLVIAKYGLLRIESKYGSVYRLGVKIRTESVKYGRNVKCAPVNTHLLLFIIFLIVLYFFKKYD